MGPADVGQLYSAKVRAIERAYIDYDGADLDQYFTFVERFGATIRDAFTREFWC